MTLSEDILAETSRQQKNLDGQQVALLLPEYTLYEVVGLSHSEMEQGSLFQC